MVWMKSWSFLGRVPWRFRSTARYAPRGEDGVVWCLKRRTNTPCRLQLLVSKLLTGRWPTVDDVLVFAALAMESFLGVCSVARLSVMTPLRAWPYLCSYLVCVRVRVFQLSTTSQSGLATPVVKRRAARVMPRRKAGQGRGCPILLTQHSWASRRPTTASPVAQPWRRKLLSQTGRRRCGALGRSLACRRRTRGRPSATRSCRGVVPAL